MTRAASRRPEPLDFICGLFIFIFDFTGASVAQLAEQVIRNDQVDGSNPFAGSIYLSPGAVMPEKTFNVDDVAEYLHIAAREIERLAREGEIPCARRGSRLEFRRREVDAWASRRIMNFSGGDLTSYHRVSSARNHDLNKSHAIIPEMMRVDYVDAAMTSKTQPSVIRDMVALAGRTGLLVYPEDLLESLVKREGLGSTAMTGGFAILHPQHHEPYMFEDSFIALGRTVQPVPFSSPDGQRTSIFFLLCCQDDRTHLHLLARICMMCLQTSLIMDLQLAADAQEMMNCMIAAEEQIIRGL